MDGSFIKSKPLGTHLQRAFLSALALRCSVLLCTADEPRLPGLDALLPAPAGDGPSLPLSQVVPQKKPAIRVEHFDAALEEAKLGNKSVLAYFHGSDWSRLGEHVKKTVWDTDRLASLLGDQFVMVEIDHREYLDLKVRESVEHAKASLPDKGAEIISIRSQGGAKFEKRDDGSWLASGTNAKTDVFEIRLRTGPVPAATLWLEALADDSLPQHGPGRSENGNFVLSEIEVALVNGPTPQPLKFTGAWADRNDASLGAAFAIDGVISEKGKEGWNPSVGRHHEDRLLVLAPEKPLPPGSTVTLKLHFASPWAQHVIGRVRVRLHGDAALAHAVSDFHRQWLLNQHNKAAGQITSYPGIVLFDADGRACGHAERLLKGLTPELLAARLLWLDQQHQHFDNLVRQAQTATGTRRADLLGEALFGSREDGMPPWSDKTQRPALLKLLRESDTNDLTSWQRALEFNPGKIAAEANRLVATNKVVEALAALDREISSPANKHLSTAQKQELLLTKFHIYRGWKGHEEQRFDALREIVKVDPETTSGIGAMGYLLCYQKGPVSLTHGWSSPHLTRGPMTWNIEYGVPKTFDHAGKYEVTLTPKSGTNVLAVKSLTLLLDGKLASADSHSSRLGPGTVATNAIYKLELPIFPHGHKLILRMACESEGGTDNKGTFEVKPLLD